MPSNTKSVAFAWSELIPNTFDEAGIQEAVRSKTAIMRGNRLTEAERSAAIFDPRLRELARLELDVLAEKPRFLVSKWLPKSQDDLAMLCRQMVDRGQNEQHIALMTERLPGKCTLDEHVENLWQIRERSPELFADIVQGYHGEAISRYKRFGPKPIGLNAFKATLSRHALIWSAADVQHAISRSKVMVERPAGKFIKTTAKQVKAKTVTRLMKGTIVVLEPICDMYQRRRARQISKKQLKVRGSARWVRHSLPEKPRKKGGLDPGDFGPVRALVRGLDNAIHYIKGSLDEFKLRISEVEATVGDRDFHQIWMSDLTDTTAAAVSLVRYAQAERRIARMVDLAVGDLRDSTFTSVNPLPIPAIPHAVRQDPLCMRVLDLLHSARCVQLRDRNNKTRTDDPHKFELLRDPLDFAGLVPLEKGIKFLKKAAPRKLAVKYLAEDYRTLLSLDILPEARLALFR